MPRGAAVSIADDGHFYVNPNAVAQRIVDGIERDFATFVGTGAPLMAVYAAQRAIDPGAYPILGSGARPS